MVYPTKPEFHCMSSVMHDPHTWTSDNLTHVRMHYCPGTDFLKWYQEFALKGM